MKICTHLLTFILGLCSISLLAQHTNIMISEDVNPEEPSIYINPKNTNHIIAGANITNYYYSLDRGYSWQGGTLVSEPYGVWGDPCVIIDTAGVWYFFHLSNPQGGNWIDRIVCQKSTDLGITWSQGTYMGLNGTKAQDKEWAVVNPQTNEIYVTWTQFDDYGSSHQNDSSIIRFSKSADGGMTWSEPLRLNKLAGDCIDSDSTVEGAVPAVGPNGEVYVAWSGPAGIMFDKSLDQGETWLDNDIFVSDQPGGWNYDIPGIYRCNGMPVTCCDISGGSYNGHIYVNWSDQRNGTDDTDIWLSKSTDGGETWSAPVRINDDPSGKHQFFTWMTIDQVTGYLYFIFYDRRNYEDNQTDVYLAVSRDGGQKFKNIKISESPFVPYSSIFFGDYNNIVAHNNIIRPIWTRLQEGNLSIWTAIVNQFTVEIEEESTSVPFSLEQNYPNPFHESTYFSFKLSEASNITLRITDIVGREVMTLIDNQHMGPGKYIEHFDPERYEIMTGVYYFTLISQNKNIKKKMLYLK